MERLRIALDEELVDDLQPHIMAIAPHAELVYIAPDGRVLGSGEAVKVWLRGYWKDRPLDVLAQLPDVRWLHTVSAGMDHVLTPALVASDIVVTNSSGANAIPIAESVMGMMLTIVKRFADHWRNQTLSRWERYRKDELYGKTLTIVGTGRIGREIARRARVFGMTTLGVTSVPREEPVFDRLVEHTGIAEALGVADFIVVAAAMTATRRGMIGADQFAQMRPTAWFLNIARGDLVDEAALLAALERGQIAGAYLDVFEQEPLPADHPFWTMPNVLVVPHNTGFSWGSYARSHDLFFDNLRRWLAGELLVNVVDKQRGY
jgi:phosphoglycerate dehydrogenase-like enzyme